MNLIPLLERDQFRQKTIEECVQHVRTAIGALAETYEEQQYMEYKVGAKLLAAVLEHLDQEVLKQDMFKANGMTPTK